MRNLEECQAEVFRRSEKRIKERRQRRNRILVACIPLVLCVTLFSAFIFAGNSKKTEGTYGNRACAVTKVEVSGLGISLSYTEPSEVLLISDRLNAYSFAEPGNGGSVKEEAVDEGFHENADGSEIYGGPANTGYWITLVMGAGGSTEYYLAGNTLTNRTTDQTCTLSKTQINELKDLLGIPYR